MKSKIIRLNLAGTVVHVNTAHIVYYYAKQDATGKITTEIHLAKSWAIEVLDTTDEIDAMVGLNIS